jgi:ABC-2 type transport system permease protein
MKRLSRLKLILTDSFTIFWGDWLDLRVRVVQIASAGLVSPIIYIIAFGLGLGSSLPKPAIGASYLEFIIPGMVALSSMTVSFTGTVFSICGERLFTKIFEEMLLLPINPLSLHIGKVIAGIFRGALTSCSVILIGILFTQKFVFLHPLFLLLMVLNCAVFSSLGVIVGLRVKSLESVGLYNNFIIIPMSFLGATFFDPSTLPPILKGVVYLLPLTYASIGLRSAAYDISHFPWYCIFVLLGTAIALSFVGATQFSTQQD